MFGIHHNKKDGGCTFYHNTLRTKLSPLGIHGKIWFNGSRAYTSSIALFKFKWLRIFLFVLLRSFRISVCKASLIVKCTSRHLFPYDGLGPTISSAACLVWIGCYVFVQSVGLVRLAENFFFFMFWQGNKALLIRFGCKKDLLKICTNHGFNNELLKRYSVEAVWLRGQCVGLVIEWSWV